ncbi:hypothetical protein C9374_001239 [Naegleria lovaniensis]|uniref:Uncharacterized protein n=1 Tax=Naegleria lovaniensis TaxID=51637 RepID=A0AA88GVG3_NAELO|nr:uncharacterized protein C9374_001239 [Naegleria lovaniensis]KAG2387645.1 hypothetical protein C9374_001239 [Naegleria lovaniensis]
MQRIIFNTFVFVMMMMAFCNHFIEGAQIQVIKSDERPSQMTSLPTANQRRDETCAHFANQFEPFDYFLLSLQWPATACIGKKPNECSVPDFINDFTIHGLWPQFKNPATYPECCFNVTLTFVN